MDLKSKSLVRRLTHEGAACFHGTIPLKQSLSILRGIKGTPDKEILNQKAQTAGLAVAQSATVLGDKGFDKAVDAMGKRIEKAAEKRTFIEKTGAR